MEHWLIRGVPLLDPSLVFDFYFHP